MSKRHQKLKRERFYRRQLAAMFIALPCEEPLESDDMPCWCGEPNPHCADVPGNCGGTGMLMCLCGGDFCVCHNHGEVECYGCEDCSPEGNENDDDYYSDDYEDRI